MKKRSSAIQPRKPLSTLAKIGILVLLLVLAYFLGGRLQPGQSRYIILSPDHYPPGNIYQMQITLKKGGKLFLVNDGGTYHAIIGTDPHDKCGIRWLRDEQVFASYCSESRYDIDGSWLSGPSPVGLDRYNCFMRHGNLVIDTEDRIKGEPAPT